MSLYVRANLYFRLLRLLPFVFDKRSNNMRAQYVGHIILVLIFSNNSPSRRSRDYAAERATGPNRVKPSVGFDADRPPVHHAREENFKGDITTSL